MEPKPEPRHPLHLVERDEDDAVADAFFQASSLAPLEIVARGVPKQRATNDAAGYGSYDDDDLADEAAPLAPGARRAMHATLAILGLSVIGVSSILLYNKVLMPTPVELGVGGGVSAPVIVQVAAAEPAAPIVAPTPVLATVVPALVAPAAAIAATATRPEPLIARKPEVSVPAAGSHAKHASTPQRAPADASSASTRGATPEDALVKQAFRELNAGRPQTAIAQARRVLDSTPLRADAWLVLGSAYDALGDHGSAQIAFRACSVRARGPFVNECKKLAR